MKNITFEGISTLQRLHLCWQIRKQIGKIHQPIKVEFHQPICRKQYSSLWYGGLVVSIKVRGCVFAIHACGDIYATLYDKSDGTELLYVKDKSNSGRFGVDVLPYLKTDHSLLACFQIMRMTLYGKRLSATSRKKRTRSWSCRHSGITTSWLVWSRLWSKSQMRFWSLFVAISALLTSLNRLWILTGSLW